MQNYFKSGVWNCICDVCGFEFKSDEVKKRWDGLMVCDKDFEHDHPQKYLRVRETGLAVPYVRAEPDDVFIQICNVITNSCYAGFAQAGCMIAGNQIFTARQILELNNGNIAT